MNLALITSAALLGLAGMPHCSAMCSAPCTALVGRRAGTPQTVFQLARMASYALGGAVAASSTSALATWSAVTPAVRPLWTLLNAGAFLLGVCLLWRGRQPAWLARLGRGPNTPSSTSTGGWQRLGLQARAAGAGALWVALPCGLLQSALLVAGLTSGAAEGALAMAAFALCSAPGLVAGPWLWGRWLRRGAAAAGEAWAVRTAGLLLSLASAWALIRQTSPGFAAYCLAFW